MDLRAIGIALQPRVDIFADAERYFVSAELPEPYAFLSDLRRVVGIGPEERLWSVPFDDDRASNPAGDRQSRGPAPDLAGRVMKRCLELGLSTSVIRGGLGVFRIAPPITISDDEIDLGLTIFDHALRDCS